jgi:chaperone required for assembly of F1-ATPase
MPADLTKTMTDETPDERMRRLLTGQFNRELPRRFYKAVSMTAEHGVSLDGRPIKTPMKNALRLPTAALAAAVAAEWEGQVKVIDTETMPLTKLANTALDRATAERAHVLQEVVDYAGSDLVCYGADRPPELVALQRTHWQPALRWAEEALAERFTQATGVTHVAQSPAALAAVRRRAEGFDAWQLTGTYLLMTLTGSALLALMLQAGAADAERVWQAAHVDEDYQISEWGEDHEAVKRRAHRRREFDGLVRFFALLNE